MPSLSVLANAWYLERTPARVRGSSWWETGVLQSFREDDWYENFRMPEEDFLILCDMLRPHVDPQSTVTVTPVTVEKRLALTLYKLASSVEFHDLSNLFGIGKSTACDIFWEMCEVSGSQWKHASVL